MGRIVVQNLVKEFHLKNNGRLLAVENFNVEIADREFVCIVGLSGCGKSTILNIISGIQDGTRGRVLINDTPILKAENRPMSVGYVFQRPRLVPWLVVEDNIKFALESENVPKAEWNERIDYFLKMVHLSGFKKAYPHQLSGGMQQRVSLARALSIDPEVLLMDEPFSGLDEITARKMRLELLEIWGSTPKTILFVTHNAFEATLLADRILIMSRRPGRVIKEIKVKTPRPRAYESEELFREYKSVVQSFLLEVDDSDNLTPQSPTPSGGEDKYSMTPSA